MDWLTVGFGLGSISLFASRAFLTAFVTALLIRFQPDLPFLPALMLPRPTGSEPTWLASNPSLIVLGILALAEFVAEKDSDARLFLDEIGRYAKPLMAALTLFGVMGVSDQAYVADTIKEGGVVSTLFLGFVAVTTWWMTTVRNGIYALINDVDGGGAVGLGRIVSYLEDVWSLLGVYALLVYPIVAATVLGGLGLLLALVRARARWKSEQDRSPCEGCGALVYRIAPYCRGCHAPSTGVRGVTWLGRSKETPAKLDDHPYDLIEVGRCPRCASRVGKSMRRCADCNVAIFDDKELRDEYVRRVGSRLPRVVLLGGLLSLIPVVGLIPGVLLYRIELVAPFARYLPIGRRFLSRWLIRLLFLALVVLQVVPVLGGLAIPIMAAVNFITYRSAFLDEYGSDG